MSDQASLGQKLISMVELGLKEHQRVTYELFGLPGEYEFKAMPELFGDHLAWTDQDGTQVIVALSAISRIQLHPYDEINRFG